MKKVLLLVAVLVAGMASANAQSENYKAFKVDLGLLYAVPGGDGAKGGAGLYIEPKYNVTDNIALGLKMEWAAMTAGQIKTDAQGALTTSSFDATTLGTYQLTGDYYFGDSKVRPFAGLGLGLYAMGTANWDVTQNSEALAAEFGTKFGFSPRAGLLLGHFRLGLEYNIITGIEDPLPSRNYLSFKVGFEIGGGKK
ncbi:MAG: outer membrane beta-barrel protein [Carboxylicivirga sp.]|jgi:outer membrane protein X|nr:outer membrane beta-barrel protein [Carboxylicivirga sp.]